MHYRLHVFVMHFTPTDTTMQHCFAKEQIPHYSPYTIRMG